MEDRNINASNEESSQSSEVDLMAAFDALNDGSNEQSEGDLEQNSEGQKQEESFEIDEKFKDLPEAEAKIRTFQSKYDKLYASHEQAMREIEEKSRVSQFFDELLSDDEVLEAFLSERKPELVKSVSGIEKTQALIKQKMQEEFGDYKPTRDEAEDDPGGKAWLYFKKLDELYNQTNKTGDNKIKTVKELRAERLQQSKMKEEEVQKQMEEVKAQMNWKEEDVVRFKEWANKLTIPMLSKMYNYAIRTMRIPNVSSMPGGSSQASARQKFLDSI